MAKKKSKSKNTKKLRREVEILRAQVKSDKPRDEKKAIQTSKSATKSKTKLETNDAYVKKDLLKTAAISTLGFAIIFALAIFA